MHECVFVQQQQKTKRGMKGITLELELDFISLILHSVKNLCVIGALKDLKDSITAILIASPHGDIFAIL